MKKQNLTIDISKFNEQASKNVVMANVLDVAKARMPKAVNNLQECLDRGVKDRAGDFFIVLTRLKDHFVKTLWVTKFFHRATCPTPNYDQVVWHYSKKDDTLEEIWVLPDRQTCTMLMDNIIEAARVDKDELKYVLDFRDGTLDEVMRKLNGEKKFSLELEK